MIKLLACLFMLADHIGVILFPDIIELRLIGRMAMPFFAFCIARGFYYSNIKKTFAAYKKRMILFAIASQVPYMLMVQEYKLDIGFLWICCLLFLELTEKEYKKTIDFFFMFLISIVVTFVPMDYGLYGFAFVLILYYFRIKKDDNIKIYVNWFFIHALKLLINFEYGIIQLFTLPCFSVLDIAEKFDNKIKINKMVFYWFYPVHILVILLIKYVFNVL